MFLSMNWIGDFVDLSGLDKKALIRNFTLSTAEVEDIIVKGEDVKGVIVAKIVSVENHPNSKKLHLLKVDTGNGVIDVVCGAPNVREGMKVALATEGGCVSGMKIATATVAGYESHGMCCSEAELGISDDHSGIIEIFEDVALGTDIKTIYDIDDIIFEVDNKSLTNRPDLWGHYGIAREFATITGRTLKAPETVSVEAYASLPPVEVNVKSSELCYRYTAMKVENVTRKISPVNMRIRLFYCGSRAINFLADLTNYVMLELGQPMHAFDNAKVDKIEVQTFESDFTFTTLDGVERNIDTNMLMITSGDEPVAIAGVMGGDASKIADDTTSLLLESATFNGVSVRKTTTRLGLRTDASMRYEKMLDPELCRLATERVLALLMKNDEGVKVISSFTDCYPYHYPTITLNFDKPFVDRYTGIDIPSETIVKTLTGLGFGITVSGDEFTVTVPSWRATKDVTIKADIIEEISRIYGYDNFEVCTSVSPLAPIREEAIKSCEDRMKDLLVKSFRLHEVHSYIWSDEKKNSELSISTPENVKIINAQTPDHQYLRVSLVPTLLSFVKENKSYGSDFGIFEIGHTVEGLRESDNYCNEKKKLGVALYSKTESEEALFGKLATIAREISGSILHKEPVFRSTEAVYDFVHPANCFDISVDGQSIGFISVPHPTVAAAIDKKCAISFLEICTEAFAGVTPAAVSYKLPSKFPEIEIDLTFAADLATLRFDEVKAAASAASELLSDVFVKDVYYAEDGSCALTLRFAFVSYERTLTKQELTPVTESVAAALAAFGLTVKE